MYRIIGRVLLVATAAMLFAIPIAALGAGSFDDVPDDNVFKADIDWLASVGVTKGCNPPANTKYCPDSNVTRGQMAAFMHRLADGVVDANTVDGMDGTAFAEAGHGHGDTYLGKTEPAADAHKLGGQDSSAFVQHGDIVTASSGTNWQAFYTASVPVLWREGARTGFQWDGWVELGLDAPATISGVGYDLKDVEVCVELDDGAFVDSTRIYRSAGATNGILVDDSTNRLATGCYTLAVSSSAPGGAAVVLNLGDSDGDSSQGFLYGVRATWSPALLP